MKGRVSVHQVALEGNSGCFDQHWVTGGAVGRPACALSRIHNHVLVEVPSLQKRGGALP